jgi:hypothetical protein
MHAEIVRRLEFSASLAQTQIIPLFQLIAPRAPPEVADDEMLAFTFGVAGMVSPGGARFEYAAVVVGASASAGSDAALRFDMTRAVASAANGVSDTPPTSGSTKLKREAEATDAEDATTPAEGADDASTMSVSSDSRFTRVPLPAVFEPLMAE